MTTGAVEEGEFPTTDDKSTLVKQAEMWLRIDGVLHRALELFNEWKGKMAHWGDRGPDPDVPERELSDLIARAAREGARRATVEIGNYNEGGNGSSPQWRNVVMTMLSTLLVIGISSLIVMFATQKEQAAQMKAMAERMDGFDHRITNLEHKVWP